VFPQDEDQTPSPEGDPERNQIPVSSDLKEDPTEGTNQIKDMPIGKKQDQRKGDQKGGFNIILEEGLTEEVEEHSQDDPENHGTPDDIRVNLLDVGEIKGEDRV
jgi:hypothetical protein